MSIFLYCWLQRRAFDNVSHEKLWKCLQQLGVPPYLHPVVKAMYTALCAKVQINADTHGEVMSNIGIKQGCLLFPTLFGLYIDELETYLDKIHDLIVRVGN